MLIWFDLVFAKVSKYDYAKEKVCQNSEAEKKKRVDKK